MPTPRVLRSGAARSRGAANKVEAGKITVDTSAYGNETVQEEMLEESSFGPGIEPAFVRVSAGKTINLGNFESLRIDVAVTIPCLPSAIDAAYTEASDFVAEKMTAEERAWLGAPSTKPKASRR
jgi:hypothetical protein